MTQRLSDGVGNGIASDLDAAGAIPVMAATFGGLTLRDERS